MDCESFGVSSLQVNSVDLPAVSPHLPGPKGERRVQLAGATYMEIHQAGGEINFTVESKRQASEEMLFSIFQQRLQCMMRAGTTLVGCKSGYALDLETELKMLRVIERVRRELDIGILAAYCGAHSVPKLPQQGGPGFNSSLRTKKTPCAPKRGLRSPGAGGASALQLLQKNQ